MRKISKITKRRSCRNCLEFSCCKGIGAPFFVTPKEIQKINERTNLPEDDFAQKQKLDGEKFYFLKNKRNHCIFFDPTAKRYRKCKIYRFRPLDCRLFPLDVYKKNGKFFWIKYTLCNGNENNVQKKIERAESRIIPFLKDFLNEYEDLEMELFEKGDWKEVGEVNIKEK